jgi:hypothetical protein
MRNPALFPVFFVTPNQSKEFGSVTLNLTLNVAPVIPSESEEHALD